MESAPDDLSKPSKKSGSLQRAIDAVVDLLDPDFEARSVGDAINFLGAIELAIKFVCARPEFLDLDNVGIQEQLHSRTLDQINWQR